MVKFPRNLKDYFLSQEEFKLIESDSTKGILKTVPQPSLDSIGRYYESEEYISHSEDKDSFFSRVYNIARDYNLSYKFWVLKKHGLKNTSKILDYGCGVGEFPFFLKSRNIEAYGYEPIEKARKIAQQKKVVLVDSLKNQTFDCITLFHVLEHIHEPSEVLKQFHSSLSENGTLVLALPNFQSFDAKYYKEYWAGFDVPRHLWHFSPLGIEALAEKEGFVLQKKYPLWLDAFYVSLLSEKYKGSSKSIQIIKGFLIGLISNIRAIQTAQYSSVVYVFSKK